MEGPMMAYGLAYKLAYILRGWNYGKQNNRMKSDPWVIFDGGSIPFTRSKN